MNRIWIMLVAFSLIVAAKQPAAAQIGGAAPILFHGVFNLAEAYPCTPVAYLPDRGISRLQVWAGDCASPGTPPGAVPGVLCLQRAGTQLDVNCFATVPAGQTGPCIVQGYQLTLTVPGSIKCPDVYGMSKQTYLQFGSQVRTWWSLEFSQPGTQFILEVTAVCRAAPVVQPGTETSKNPAILSRGGQAQIHKDEWTWQVVADVNTMACLIELMHTGAVSTLEVPCIIGEDMYDALKSARQRLAAALNLATPDPVVVQDAIFDFEALIVANCLFVEVMNPVELFPGPDQFGAANFQPPGNAAPAVLVPGAGMAVAGLLDTTEHPCCCKLLVDLEAIARRAELTAVF